jgi:Zn-dependent M28 family amino/carboxypeptidase
MRAYIAGLIASILLLSCAEPAVKPVHPLIDANLIKTHLERISAAELEGRVPGSKGEQVALNYIGDVMRLMGLRTVFEEVPLARLMSQAGPLRLTGAAARLLELGTDFIAWTRQQKEVVTVDADLIFVGYGIVAPEHKWDDFKNVDVKGKILVELIGDPRFGTRSILGRTGADYYGRLAYKFEEATQKGAAGVLIIHEEAIAGFSWDVIKKSAAGNMLEIDFAAQDASHVAFEGWLSNAAAASLFKAAGMDLADLKRKAAEQNFTPVPMSLKGSIEIQNTISSVLSNNVIGILEGRTQEYVVYSSNWNDPPAGDAGVTDLSHTYVEDHPSGIPVMLEIARAFTREPKPLRSVAFLAETAEAEGLLGMQYYLEDPKFFADRIRTLIHIAGFSPHGFQKEMRIIGQPFEALKGLLRMNAVEQGRFISSDIDPERLYYFRYSQFDLTSRGIPSIFVSSLQPGADEPQGGAADSQAMDATVAVLDAQLLFDVGLAVANANYWPQMKRVQSSFTPRDPAKK